MVNSFEISGCGILCSNCEYLKGEKLPKCPGCNAIKGNPFWGKCHIYNCISEHDVDQCGKCQEFPCNTFISAYDPSHGPKSAITRAGVASYRAKHGDKKTADLLRKLSKA